MELTEQRYGRWTITGADPANRRHALAVCDCGTESSVDVFNLHSGKSKGCAKCARHDGPLVHGLSHSRVWRTWMSMIQRCHNPNNPSYPNYGGRGIYVCDQWRRSVATFHADMGNRPAGTTLDRIDNDGPYLPENCRWATRREQASNTRRTKTFEFQGEQLTTSELARRTGFNRTTIDARLKRGWSVEDAVSQPLRW